MAGSPEASAGAAYAGLIADQLAEERSRKASLESRGITVVTTSASLATILFGLVTALASVTKYRLPETARLPVVLAVVVLVAAGGFGLMTNIPLRYEEPTARGLGALVDGRYWTAPAEIGELRVAQALVKTIAAAREANRLKVVLLLAAVLCELAAVTFLAWAVAAVVYIA